MYMDVMCKSRCMSWCVHMSVCVRVLDDTLEDCFHFYINPRGEIPMNQGFYPLSHLTNPGTQKL